VGLHHVSPKGACHRAAEPPGEPKPARLD
jgi:hypothetical protein